VTDLRKILDSDGKELRILRQWAADLQETEAGCNTDYCPAVRAAYSHISTPALF
jgi:hypothetical protein